MRYVKNKFEQKKKPSQKKTDDKKKRRWLKKMDKKKVKGTKNKEENRLSTTIYILQEIYKAELNGNRLITRLITP